MKTKTYAKIGAAAGWLAMLSITFFQNVGPQQLTGQREPSGVVDEALLSSYYNHPDLNYYLAGQFLAVFFFILLAVALYEALRREESARFFAQSALVFAAVQVSLLSIRIALSATFVQLATNGGEVAPVFHFYDFLYSGGINMTEAGFAGFFALAMWRHRSAFPRWTPYFGFIAAPLLLLNTVGRFVGLPDVFVAHLAVVAFLLGSTIGLTRLALQTVPAQELVQAS